MHRGFVRFAVASLTFAGASLAFAWSTGPPSSRTGAPAIGGVAAEGLCTQCHTSFIPNLPGATLEILGVPPVYEPNTFYELRVRMTSTFPQPRRWGFQITSVRESDGQGGGQLQFGGTNTMQAGNGAGAFASRRYLEHTSVGTYDENPGPVEWSFFWFSPASNEGRIVFFCAGNAANSDGQHDGDHIYTARDTAEGTPPVDVPGTANLIDALDAARPNPFRDATTLGFVVAASGRVELSIFDPQGRRVRSLISGDHPAGRAHVSWDGRRDDGGAASPGVYLVRLVTPGGAAPLTRRIVLAR